MPAGRTKWRHWRAAKRPKIYATNANLYRARRGKREWSLGDSNP